MDGDDADGAQPLVLFDPADYALSICRLASPSLVTKAPAPTISSWLVGEGTLTLSFLATIAVTNLVCTLGLWSMAQRM